MTVILYNFFLLCNIDFPYRVLQSPNKIIPPSPPISLILPSKGGGGGTLHLHPTGTLIKVGKPDV